MHDKVSVVNGFSFWLFPGILFQGPKSIVMQTSIVFEPKSQEEGEVSEGGTPAEESQASDSIM